MKRFLITFFLVLTLCSSSYAVDELDATKPANSDLISTYPSYLRETRTTVNEIIDSLDQAYIGTNGSYGYVGVANSGKITWSSASPTDGTWSVGDICFNSASSTENDYWICSTAGTPGTWRRSDYSDTLSNTELANFVLLADVKRNINQADETYGRSTTATNVTASTTSSVFGSGDALLLTTVTSTNSYLLGYTTLLNGLSAGYYTFVFDLNVISATTATVAASTSGDSYTTTLAQGHHIVSIPFYFDGSTNTNCSVVVSTPSAGTQCSIESIRVFSGVKSISTINTLILASSVPASGTWLKGDKAFSTADSRGMWACTAGGTPGTWVVANGDVSKVSTPTNHQIGVWTGDGTLKGLSVTGSKVMCTDANGEPVACTNLTDTTLTGITGIVKSNGTTFSAAVAGTDYTNIKNVRSIGEWSGDLDAAVAALDVEANAGEDFVIVIDQATTMSADVDLSSLSNASSISLVFLDKPDAVLTLDNDDDLTIATGPAEYDFSHFAISGTASITFNYSVAARVSTYAQLADAIICTPSTIIVAADIDLTANGGSTTTVPSGTKLTCTPGSVITTDADDTLVYAVGSYGPGPDVTWQCFSGAGVSFAVGTVREVYPEWWGIDGTSDQVEINYAITATPSVVKLLALAYSINDSIELSSGKELVGQGLTPTVITSTSATDSPVIIDGITIGLKNVKVVFYDNFTGVGIDCRGVTQTSTRQLTFDNVSVYQYEVGTTTTAYTADALISFEGTTPAWSGYNYFIKVVTVGGKYGLKTGTKSFTFSTFEQCQFSYAGLWNLYLVGAAHCVFNNMDCPQGGQLAESTDLDRSESHGGYYISGSRNIVLNGVWDEHNAIRYYGTNSKNPMFIDSDCLNIQVNGQGYYNRLASGGLVFSAVYPEKMGQLETLRITDQWGGSSPGLQTGAKNVLKNPLMKYFDTTGAIPYGWSIENATGDPPAVAYSTSDSPARLSGALTFQPAALSTYTNIYQVIYHNETAGYPIVTLADWVGKYIYLTAWIKQYNVDAGIDDADVRIGLQHTTSVSSELGASRLNIGAKGLEDKWVYISQALLITDTISVASDVKRIVASFCVVNDKADLKIAGVSVSLDSIPALFETPDSFVLSGSVAFDPAELVDGAGETTTVTVYGARVGDRVAAAFSLDLQGIILAAWVSADDTVSVRLQNETAGTLDLGSGTLAVKVFKDY